MSSAAKTLKLLSFFSPSRPEIGLSQLCRLAGRDKATTYRYLQALEETGFIEQNPQTKHYRLGPAVLQLAQTREATVPRKVAAQNALEQLANATGETVHVSVLSGATLFALSSVESPRHSIRAIIDITTFPLHATASGLCAVAFGPADLFEAATENMQIFTEATAKSPQELQRLIRSVRATGIGCANGSLEDDIYSLSAPLFDHSQQFAGAVSVASVAARVTPQSAELIRSALIAASLEITRNWGGSVPEEIALLWDKPLSQPMELEPTS